MSRCNMICAALVALVTASPAFAQEQTLWKFDNLGRIGGIAPKV